MADFIISPYAISYESIKNNLQAWVQSKPEETRWLDFYASSAGETVIELAAALGAFYAYHFITSRRESFMSTAQNYTSLLGLAENLGYSVSRGSNVKLNIKVVPNVTKTLSKWEIVGAYGTYDLVLTEDVILNKGVSVTLPCVIGNLLQQSLTVSTNEITTFTYTNSEVTDDFYITLNDKMVPSATQLKDAAKDYYVALSNIYGAVDVFYLQQGNDHTLYQVGATNKTGWVTVAGNSGDKVDKTVKIYTDEYLKEYYENDGTFVYSGDTILYNYYYQVGDSLALNFIERNNLTFSMLSANSLAIDFADRIDEHTLIQDRIEKESAESIRLKGPIYHETSMAIRSRKDFCKYLLQNNSDIIQANDKDIFPGLIALTYIKEDGSNLSSSEKEYWVEQIKEATPDGVAEAIIEDSVLVKKNLAISLWKTASGNISPTIKEDIQAILDTYKDTFQVGLDLSEIEHSIEQLTGVKIARVELADKEWAANTKYNLYDMVKLLDKTCYASSYIYKTGSTQPNWPNQMGATVVDGDIVWTKVPHCSDTIINDWKAKEVIDRYDYVRKQYIVEGDYNKKSGDTEPTWGGDEVLDNLLTWTKTTDPDVTDTWKANTLYDFDSKIKTTSGVYKVSAIKRITNIQTDLFMCTGYANYTGSSAPTWTTTGDIEDNQIIWRKLGTTTDELPSWTKNTLHFVGDEIKVGGVKYRVIGYRRSSGTNPVEDEDETIIDGQIRWTPLDGTTRLFNLAWDEHLELGFTYQIVG